MATLTAASRRLSELGRALLVIRMTSPHPAHLRRFSTYKRCCAALLQLVMAQYRRHRVRAMPLPRLLQRTGVRFAQQRCGPAAAASRKCGRPGKSIIDRVTSRLRITLRDAAADSQTAPGLRGQLAACATPALRRARRLRTTRYATHANTSVTRLKYRSFACPGVNAMATRIASMPKMAA